jgi:hypothetical protein
LPMETFLLAMLLEEHKEVMRLRQLVEDQNREDQHGSNRLAAGPV